MKCIFIVVIISLLVACKNSKEVAYEPYVALKKEVVLQNNGSLNHLLKVAQNNWGNNYTIILTVKSEALKQVAMNKQIYYIGFNKANPSGYLPNYRAIVVGDDKMELINTDDDALAFIYRQKSSVKTFGQANLIINAFADLRNYTMLNRGNNLINENYTQKISETDDGWIIPMAFNVNLVGYNHILYKFKITKLGTISILSTKMIRKYPGGK